MPNLPRTISLPARPTTADLEVLRRSLLEMASEPVEISAVAWQRFDSLTLQFLLALHADWRARGLRLMLTNVSADLGALLRRIGVSSDMLAWEEAQ